MRKLEEITFRNEKVIIAVVFALCSVGAFVGLATDHKEMIAIAFIALSVFIIIFAYLAGGDSRRTHAFIKEASKRTKADMLTKAHMV